MESIYNPINQTFEKLHSKDGQKILACYQLAHQWKEETETPFDNIMDMNGIGQSIHKKGGKDILRMAEVSIMGGGSTMSKLIKDAISNNGTSESLRTESINRSNRLNDDSNSFCNDDVLIVNKTHEKYSCKVLNESSDDDFMEDDKLLDKNNTEAENHVLNHQMDHVENIHLVYQSIKILLYC